MGGFFARAGSPGIDHSVNASAVPVAGWVLLQTINVNARRNFVEIQNQSTSTIQIVRDDGTGANVTSMFAAGAGVSPGQGGGWTSDTFKGRLKIYGPAAGLEVAAYED